MSTKAIREALNEAKESTIDAGVYDSEVERVISNALAEVEEIERVARLVSSKEYRSPRQALDAIAEALAMCESIAMEAP